MELTFKEESIPCLLSAGGDIQDLEQVQEVKLPDSMPDIGRVLGCWGQLMIRGKEWHADRASCSGGVLAWVLYAPEDGSDPQMVECWIPMQCKWDLMPDTREGVIRIRSALKSVDARCISARKLMVRSCAAMEAALQRQSQMSIYVPHGLPEDIQVLMHTYPLELPVEAGEKLVTLDDDVTLPDAQGEIMNYRLVPKVTDHRVMGQRLVFRGNGMLRIMYRDSQGQIRTFDTEIPFSQFAELDREFSPEARAQMDPEVTNLEVEKTEDGSVRVKAGLVIQYVVYDKTDVRVAADAYSPAREVNTQMQTLDVPAVLDRTTELLRPEETVPGTGEIVDVTLMQDLPRISADANGVQVEMSCMAQALYLDENHQLQSHTVRVKAGREHMADQGCAIQPRLYVDMTPEISVTADAFLLRPELQLQLQTVCDAGIQMVSGLETGEKRTPDPSRPSVILRRCGERSLWELAKACNSTVDAIEKANALTDIPAADRFLLIPVP